MVATVDKETVVTEEIDIGKEVNLVVAMASIEVMAETTRIVMVVHQADGVAAKAAKSGPTATETTMMMTATATRGKAGVATTIAITGETETMAVAKAMMVDTRVASESAQTSGQRRQPKQRVLPGRTCQ